MAAAILCASIPAFAQPAPVLSSTVETGWTSNAEGRAGGSADHYVTHAHSVGLSAAGEAFALRGALGFEQTRYHRLLRENDWIGTLSLDGEALLAPAALLRGSLKLSYEEEGHILPTDSGPVGLVSPTLRGAAGLRLETGFNALILGLDLAYAPTRPGDTRVEAGLLPDTRTRANTDLVTAGLDIAHPIAPDAAIALRGQYSWLAVEPEDQQLYGRLPLSLARLAAGLQWDGGLSLRAGFDAILPENPLLNALFVPYGEADIRLPLADALTLAATLSAGADIDDPADGLADWKLKSRGSLALAIAPEFVLEAALFAAQSRSPALGAILETERGAELLARWMPQGGPVLEAVARHRHVRGHAPAYEENRLGLRISAAI